MLVVTLLTVKPLKAQKYYMQNDYLYECITSFPDDGCTNNLELQCIFPANRNNSKFIRKGIDSVVADVYIGGIFKTRVTLDRDVKDINVWKKNIGVKKYDNTYYKFKYHIISKQKTGLRKRSKITYSAGNYRQTDKFKSGYDYVFKNEHNIHIPRGAIGIGSFGYTYSPLISRTTVCDNYSLYGSMFNTTIDFGIGLKLGINLLEWNYLPFNNKLTSVTDSLPRHNETGVHIFSSPKIMLLYDLRLYRHIPVPCRTFRPYHFTLSPYVAFKPVEWVVFDHSLNNSFTYAKSLEAGIRLHSSLYFVELVYSYRFNDIYYVNHNEINLKNPGVFSLRFGITFDWYN